MRRRREALDVSMVNETTCAVTSPNASKVKKDYKFMIILFLVIFLIKGKKG